MIATVTMAARHMPASNHDHCRVILRRPHLAPTLSPSANWAVHIYAKYAKYGPCNILHIDVRGCIFLHFLHIENGTCIFFDMLFCIFCILKMALAYFDIYMQNMPNNMQNNNARFVFFIFFKLQYAKYAEYAE
jgi:hypothetical protein